MSSSQSSSDNNEMVVSDDEMSWEMVVQSRIFISPSHQQHDMVDGDEMVDDGKRDDDDQNNFVIVRWSSSPLSDMIADSVISLILGEKMRW